MLTDPARHFAEVSARRHLKLNVLMREVFCGPETPEEPATTGPSQPTPNTAHADALPDSTAQNQPNPAQR